MKSDPKSWKCIDSAAASRDGSVSVQSARSVGRSVGTPQQSRLKYLNNYWMDLQAEMMALN